MLSMKQVEVIQKRVQDTGLIFVDETLELIETLKIKDAQLTNAVATVCNLGRCPANERTVN